MLQRNFAPFPVHKHRATMLREIDAFRKMHPQLVSHYSGYNPSAPFIELTIDGYEASHPPMAIEGFLDSGADGTMIPIGILTAVGAEYEDTVWMSGTAGVAELFVENGRSKA